MSALTASIYLNNAGLPSGSALANFTTTGTLSGGSNIDFSGSFILQKSTTYWLVLKTGKTVDSDTVAWTYRQNPALSPLAGNNGQINPTAAISYNSGAIWTPYTAPNLTHYRFAISSIGIPEPSSLALFMIGTGAMGFIGRRKGRKA